MIGYLFVGVVLLALLFALTNGFIDGGGLASTVIISRSLSPFPALLLVAFCEGIGLLSLGRQVVHTLARDLVVYPPGATSLELLLIPLAALLGALGWNLSMWRRGVPSSSTHALLGGLAGAIVAHYGTGSVHWGVFMKIFLFLGLVPVAGILFSFAAAKSAYRIGAYCTPAASRFLRWIQIGALAGTAMAHGSNDGQKAMGLMLMAAIAFGGAPLHAGALPLWLWALCGLSLGAGVLFGSRRTIRTVGRGLYRVQTIESVCAGTATAALVGFSSLAGVPMSTSHVMSASVLGAGVAAHPRGVRWSVVWDIALAWLVTIPAAGLAAALWVFLLRILHVVS